MGKTRHLSVTRVEHRILLIRGQKVMLDSYLAELYGVKTEVLNQAVKRNRERFPEDFMFQLSREESHALRSQFVILKRGQHRKYLSYVFTEQGVAMLSSVLRSKRAIQVNIAIMRAFVRLRRMLMAHKDLVHKLANLEHRIEGHDAQIRSLFDAIREFLEAPPAPSRRRIGFHAR